MKRHPNIILKSLSAITLTLLLGAAQVNATQTVRELWDGIGAGGALYGKGSGSTSAGFDTNTTWTVSPVGQTGLSYDNGGSLSWEFGGLEYNGVLLSASGGGNGLAAFYGNNMTTLTNPATAQPYGLYSSQSYATRALATNACIDFQANGTYYFSVRVIKTYPWWVGDNAEGIGFASSGATNANFVGAGYTRRPVYEVDPANNPGVYSPGFMAEDGVTDLGNSVYISTGTLNQAGISGHPDDSGGAYYPRATAPITYDPNNTDAYLLVGRITTTTSGASTLDVKTYYSDSTLDTNADFITWDATYSFTETNIMTRLLLWGYGTGAALLDGIRVGTSYGDVIGLELAGHPTANPGSTIYAGTDVTLGANAGLNTGAFPMTFQWSSNNVAILDATNSTLALTNPTTAFTADYSVVVNNYYGTLTNQIHLTVNAAVAPFFVAGGKPVSTSRFVGAPTALFTAVVDGTPPFAYQWKYAGTNVGSVTVTSQKTNTLTFGPVALSDVGDYSVTVTNLFGSTNSAVPGPATLTIIAPAAGSYASVLTSYTSLYGYWRLDDNVTTNDTTVYDDWGNNNGYVNYNDLTNDPVNWTFGAAGVAYAGFKTPHLATSIGNEFWNAPYRLDLPQLPGYSNTMTFAMWVKPSGGSGCALMARNGYGDAYGLESVTYTVTNGAVITTNINHLQFDWGGGIAWDSGLALQPDTWTFIALVVEPGQATFYMATNKTSLVSAVSDPQLLFNSDEIGDAATALTPLAVGRNPWPWAEVGNGSQWASSPGTWSDVAVIYQSLTAQEVQDLFMAGVGPWLQGAPDGAGNLILNWSSGDTLQEATDINGPYSDISAATPPYSVPLLKSGNKFYRVKH